MYLIIAFKKLFINILLLFIMQVLSVQWHKGGTFISSALDQTVCVWSCDDPKLKYTLRYVFIDNY